MRRTIVEKLRERPQSVGELAREFPVSRPAISRHLRLLQAAGLVEYVPDGRRNVYTARPEGFAAVQDYLDQLWGDALARFKLVAENLEDA